MDNYYFIYIIKCLRVRPSRIESLCVCVCSIEMVLSVFFYGFLLVHLLCISCLNSWPLWVQFNLTIVLVYYYFSFFFSFCLQQVTVKCGGSLVVLLTFKRFSRCDLVK